MFVKLRAEAAERRAIVREKVFEFDRQNSWEYEVWDEQPDELNDVADEASRLFISDPQKSFRLYLAAAESGHIPSIYAIGLFHGKGNGVDKDPDEAIKWFKRASDAGSWLAGLQYARTLRSGGRKEEARDWFEQAVDAGHLPSNYWFARMLWHDRNIENTKQRILTLLEELIAYNHLGAHLMLARMMIQREYGLRQVPKGIHLIYDLQGLINEALVAKASKEA